MFCLFQVKLSNPEVNLTLRKTSPAGSSHILGVQKLVPGFCDHLGEQRVRSFQGPSRMPLPVDCTLWWISLWEQRRRLDLLRRGRTITMMPAHLWKFYFTCVVKGESHCGEPTTCSICLKRISASLGQGPDDLSES